MSVEEFFLQKDETVSQFEKLGGSGWDHDNFQTFWDFCMVGSEMVGLGQEEWGLLDCPWYEMLVAKRAVAWHSCFIPPAGFNTWRSIV